MALVFVPDDGDGQDGEVHEGEEGDGGWHEPRPARRPWQRPQRQPQQQDQCKINLKLSTHTQPNPALSPTRRRARAQS